MNGDSWRWAEWVDGAVTLVLGTAARMPVGEMKAASDSWRPAVSATVFYRGAWTGLLRVGCDWTAAESFAERFVGLPAGGRHEETMCDAIGELASMVAAQLKPLLPGGVTMSVPAVNLRDEPRGARWRFAAGGGRIEVHLMETTAREEGKRYPGN